VDLHKGGISLQSTEGEGCRFTLRLPAAGVLAAARTAIDHVVSSA
jgi:signal transduction histidine kinase